MSLRHNQIYALKDLLLFNDLTQRFGISMAHNIMQQLEWAEDIKAGKPVTLEYCGIKALSEVTDIYRNEAKATLARLKLKGRTQKAANQNTPGWEALFLKTEFDKNFQYYLRFQQCYYQLYRCALAQFQNHHKPASQANQTYDKAALSPCTSDINIAA
jgi:hypothetical protein